MGLEQSIDKLADALNHLATALGDKSTEALMREQKWNTAKDEDFPPEETETKKLQHPDEDPKPETETTTTQTIKLETVRAKLASLSQAGKQKDVKALLTSFGVKKLSDVPGERYAELLKKAEELA
ncbi:hypothetical protein NIE88_04785 [Sporolactobacillus shoreicorticis]|uniref:rRNA biogenesis protein rrp5 n=1 Tax=Sporolactobacillus shoreicorticis TaxID=1923877 RepID=A0ABW5S095_9BACL|nr:hypothetical protein [Sporolactobacillus shoreicorticis]MCO7125089.1 hypothetical protein [Sporolactobacillus shoreicorticis]